LALILKKIVKKIAVNILISICAIVLLFVFLEIFIRVFKVETVIVHKGYGVNKEQPTYFNPSQTHFYKTKESSFTIAINKYGRRDKEWDKAVFSDSSNIIFIGDSLILGYGVDDEWCIPSVIEKLAFERKHKEIEIFNFSIVDISIPEYKQLLEDALAMGIKAKNVVVGVFVGNDFINETKTTRKKKNAANQSLEWLSSHSKLYAFLKLRIGSSPQLVRQALYLGRLINVNLYDSSSNYIYLKRQTAEEEAYFQHILEYLGEIKGICLKNNQRLYVVIFPNKIQVENRKDFPLELFDMEKPNRLIGQYCREKGIKYLDLLSALNIEYEKTHEVLYYAIDRHFTKAGNFFSSELITSFLEEQGVL